ncbi:unnamed protein product [Schistosoma turkestanicum]|nr:unnamed protein product [Schistosoma turkestanicum]
MGGKKKTTAHQPRVKENSKPTSSDKATRFLVKQTGGLGIPSTYLLNAELKNVTLNSDDLKTENCQGKLTGFVPILQDPDASGLDSHLLNILKRLEKRDSVTKQKALREFCELLQPELNQSECVSLSTSSVVAVLPFWPRIYHHLSFDRDRKVRELVQTTMHALASRVGKDLCLYLKQIVPIWTFSTVDTYESAALFANKGLCDTFPGKKLIDVHCLCSKQLLDMVETQLSELTQRCTDRQSFSQSKRGSPVKNSDNPAGSSTTESSSYYFDLSSTLRFLASFVGNLIHLSSDHKQLIRLKMLLCPEGIWDKVAHCLKALRDEQKPNRLDQTCGTLSGACIAVYKLCSVLCRSPSWCRWMKETNDGKALGEYISNITVGSLGVPCGLLRNTLASDSVDNSTTFDLSNGVYSSLWDATLACLTGLSGQFVWSVVDWDQVFVARLENILNYSEKNQAKQAYIHLLCLLNEFPLDYSDLKNHELEILEKLFIDSTLLGVHRSLGYVTLSDDSCNETGSCLPDDPDLSIVVAKGTMECARYLVDRLLTPMGDEHRKEVLLAKKMYSQVIMRLFSDCLITHTRANNSPHLVCSRPPLSRQSYLNVIFDQTAKFCNNIAQSNHHLKIKMYDELRNTLLKWISLEKSDEFIAPIIDGKVNRMFIGIVDPLRLISFVDHLAKSSIQKANRYTPTDSKISQRVDNKMSHNDLTVTVQTDWCINLFHRINDILLNNIQYENVSENNLNDSFHVLLFLCIYGHLPFMSFSVPCILRKIFSSLLSKLPREVHAVCWSYPAIQGLANLWVLTSEDIDNEAEIPTDSSVCLLFTNNVLPQLILSSPNLRNFFDSVGVSTKLLSNRISNTLCFWAQVWFDKVISSDEIPASTVVVPYMYNLHSLIINSLHHISSSSSVNNDSDSPEIVIPVRLVETLCTCLKRRYENMLFCDYVNYTVTSSSELRIIGSLLIHLLRMINNNNVFSSSCLDYLHLLLTKILFCSYSTSAFVKIKESSDALHSSESTVDDHLSSGISLTSVTNHDNLHDDDTNGDVVFNFKELIDQSELIILKRLSLEEWTDCNDESFFSQFSNLLFRNTVSSKFGTPLFYDFASRIYSTVQNKPNSSSFTSNFSMLWLKYLIKHVNIVLEAVVKLYPLPEAFFISRHLIQNHSICPSFVLPDFGQLVRLHQLGLLLRLHVQFMSNDNDVCSTQYLLCLGFIRVWISSFCEPLDLYTDIGWLSQQTDLNELKVNGQLEHYEPSVSAAEKSRLFLAKTLGSFWHEFTAGYPLSRLLSLSSPNALKSIVALESQTYYILQSTINSLLLNRLRTMHPNLWPNDIKLAASCSDDDNQKLTWIDMYLPLNSCTEKNSVKMQFNRCIELYLPAGVIRRCLPRQELFGRLKSFSLSIGEYSSSDLSDQQLKSHAYIIELISSLVNVRATAPIYLTTFSSIILEDYRTWLANLTGSITEDKTMCLQSPSVFNICLSVMNYLECLLLLWQPWQWSVVESEKSPISVKLGLVQLSTRMRQLRPSLSTEQWDFILCWTVSWVYSVVHYFCLSSSPGFERTLYDLLATRVFRMSAALGAIFIERYSYLSVSDCIILKETNPSKRVMQSDNMDVNDVDECEDEEPVNEFFDEEEHARIFSDVQYNSNDQSKDISSETMTMDFEEESETEVIQMGTEEDPDLDDEEYMYSVFAKGLPLIPRRAEAPLQVRNDWGKFFAPDLYSTLLKLVLRSCIPSEHGRSQAVLDTDIHLQALCATFATCPVNHLVTAFSNQPSLIFECLNDFQLKIGQPCVISQLFSSKIGSVNDYTIGFRASLDMACKLVAYSPHQSGQLLGYILLNRLAGTRLLQGNNKTSVSIVSYMIRRIPSSWMSALSGLLPPSIEKYLQSEVATDHWGRGSSSLLYLIDFSNSGWTVNCRSHQALLGYLLAWDSLLSLMTCGGPQTRASLQNALLSSSATIFDRFMLIIGLLLPPPGDLEDYINTFCRLEPDERLLLPNSTSRAYLTAALTVFCSRRYSKRPVNLVTPISSGDDSEWRDAFSPDDSLIRIPGHRVATDINHLAVRLFRRFLSEAPALVRAWHTQLTSSSSFKQSLSTQASPLATHRPGRLRQLAGTIDKIVSKYFSSRLSRDEVVLVQYRSYLRMLKKERTSSKGLFSLLKSSAEVGSVQIKGRPLSHEIIATYYVDDEHSMEMIIQLPNNYPLSPITISKGRSVGVGSQQWQSWILQMSVFINNHNGSILDGIDLWQSNVRKKFDGVEECPICYSIVHNTNFSLPKMRCHTCRALFHYACMYKWFTTSRNPACPLCRHLFIDPTGRPTST